MSAGAAVTRGCHREPHLNAFNGKLYFTGNDVSMARTSHANPGRGLFVYDPVTNQASEIINCGGWQGNPYFNQTTMAVFNNNLYFSAGMRGAGGEVTAANLWRIDATLNSQGQATAHLVASGGLQGGRGGFNPLR